MHISMLSLCVYYDLYGVIPRILPSLEHRDVYNKKTLYRPSPLDLNIIISYSTHYHEISHCCKSNVFFCNVKTVFYQVYRLY